MSAVLVLFIFVALLIEDISIIETKISDECDTPGEVGALENSATDKFFRTSPFFEFRPIVHLYLKSHQWTLYDINRLELARWLSGSKVEFAAAAFDVGMLGPAADFLWELSGSFSD